MTFVKTSLQHFSKAGLAGLLALALMIIFILKVNFLGPFSSSLSRRYSRRTLAALILSLTMMAQGLTLAWALTSWQDVTLPGSWSIGYFVEEVGDKNYFAFQDSSTSAYALVQVSSTGIITDV
ncbi:MAG TPA: hypothetical protein VEC96_14380, partial [Anaerolineae bacterium]|nr:hypothetical protein [Anaerolineae bacterium]